jgi:F-type H+-transporting ATPase subunit b
MAIESNSAPGAPAPDGQVTAEAAEAVHGHEAAGGTTAVAEHGGEGDGLPQFRFEYWGGQIVWLLLIFAALYVLLGKVFAPRIRKILDERKATIASAIDEARRVRTEADAQAAAAQADLVEARARSQRIAADAKAKAKAEVAAREAAEEARIAERLAEAETRIRASRDEAMGSVREVAADTTTALVAKLTGKAATKVEVNAALKGA